MLRKTPRDIIRLIHQNLILILWLVIIVPFVYTVNEKSGDYIINSIKELIYQLMIVFAINIVWGAVFPEYYRRMLARL
jgi:hypothetical protein